MARCSRRVRYRPGFARPGMTAITRLPIAVIGAGLVGRTHIDRVLREPGLQLVGIADPAPAAQQVAEAAGVRWFAEFDAMLDAVRPRAAVVASPNATHAAIAIHCLERGVAVLVEKPVADTVEDAHRIVAAAAAARLPAIVGH